ncbi:hypothetical protein MBLNU230_g6253t1 [Neophaeotheca triangularis]
MGQQPRASRRKHIVVSDDEEEATSTPIAQVESEEEGLKPARRKQSAAGKLKPVKKTASKTQEHTPPQSTQTKSARKSPAKGKTSKTKTNPEVNDQTKTNGKSIASFFNAAVQRQQQQQPRSAHPSASPERPLPSQEQAEEISSDFSDDGGNRYSLSKGSSTALALRKRKGQHDQHLASQSINSSLPPAPTQKFRKTNDGLRQPSVSVFNEDKRPWIDQFAPAEASELAVHKRKIDDVKRWLSDAFGGRRRKVLVLKGAAGTGKTATLQLLAKELAVEVLEWKSPVGNEYATEGSISASAQFEEFVARAGKSSGLTFATNEDLLAHGDQPTLESSPNKGSIRPQLLLVEEFPSTFSRDSPMLLSFRSTLLQYLSAPLIRGETPTPIILIVSETLLSTSTAAADSFTAHRLLGPELSNHPFLNTIEFNPIAPTILTKALEAVVLKEARKTGRRRTPGPQVLKHIAEGGDIRSAISSLEFLCIRGDEDNLWSNKITFTKPKTRKPEPALTKAETEAISLISNRESSLGIFHAVGKIVYNKRLPPPPGTRAPQPAPHLQHLHRPLLPETNPDRLLDDLGTDTSTFLASLHENYALSTTQPGPNSSEQTLETLSTCLEALSDADTLSLDRFSFGTRAFSGSASDSLRQDELAFQTAVRGVLFALPCPVHRVAPAGAGKRDAHRMFYPQSLRLWRGREEVEGVLEVLTRKALTGGFGTGVKAAVGSGGDVGGWAKKPDKWSEGSAAGGQDGGVLTASRSEMLLERLPYMSRIASGAMSPALREQIAKVTSVRTTAVVEDDSDSLDAEDRDAEAPVEAWATDLPESGRGPKKGDKGRQRGEQAEVVGSKLAVESAVQSLVLEDDDIEDF